LDLSLLPLAFSLILTVASNLLHPEHRRKLPYPGTLDKPLVQPHPQGGTSTIKRNHKLPAYRRPPQTQQSKKEHDKCPPNQTKEEEIGSLPEKEFRIMTVKIIQNLENKMELQINSLETRIEKMQEMLNKDLEEVKKSQSIINNAVTEIKNILEVTNSRITEAEDRISEVEDRMVEISEAERKKELKEMRTTLETSGTMSNAPTFKS